MHRTILAVAIGLSVAAAYATASALPPLDAELVESGRSVFAKHCASCHGARAEGDARLGAAGRTRRIACAAPRREGHTWKHSDAMLYRIVMRGWRDPFNKTDRLTMPGFSEILSPREVRAVITYLKTLWTPEQRRFQGEESRNQPFP